MQELYLIRHGQAGLRSDYDQLSELGGQQARLLADWFAQQGIQFDQVRSGGLKRQRMTAAAFGKDAIADMAWNEFDLDAVYASIAPQLAAVDEAFRAEYETLQAEASDPAHPVHRAWRPSDLAVVQAWIGSRFAVSCETWAQFQERIWSAIEQLDLGAGHHRVALVTSATPIGIATAKLFEAPTRHVFELAGSLHNTSFTVLRRRGGNWTLAGFNHTPHLTEEKLRTLR
jgi:broad specificity phosphatase PhoE